jgi:hypothetical protein
VTARALACYDEVVAAGAGAKDITAFAVRKIGFPPARE